MSGLSSPSVSFDSECSSPGLIADFYEVKFIRFSVEHEKIQNILISWRFCPTETAKRLIKPANPAATDLFPKFIRSYYFFIEKCERFIKRITCELHVTMKNQESSQWERNMNANCLTHREPVFFHKFVNILGHSEMNAPNKARKICLHDISFNEVRNLLFHWKWGQIIPAK